jgi:hypothetical protein
MSEESIVPMTRRALADAIDGYDNQITALQNAKRELYNTSRAQLAKAGYKPAAAKAEVEACKAAIRKRRAAAKDQQAVEERDALVDKIFEEISSPRARRATHAREDEAASLPAGYASSSESLEDRANPDAVRQGSLSETEGDALVEETDDEVSSVRAGRATRAYEDEAASLPGDPRSSEILEGNPSPDAVPPGSLSETEGASGRLEAPVADRHPSIAAAQGARPITRAGSPEMSPQGEPAMEAPATYAVDLPTDRSDPGDIPDFLRRTDGIRPIAAMLREMREQAATSCAT